MALVYLAGPIRGTDYKECTDWREYAKEKLTEAGITGISPMRGKEFLKDERKIDFIMYQYQHPLTIPKGIVSRDRFDVMRCDILLINLLGAKEVSIGTMIEIGWADILRKPVVLVMEQNNPHRHPMITELPGFIVDNLDEAIQLITEIIKP